MHESDKALQVHCSFPDHAVHASLASPSGPARGDSFHSCNRRHIAESSSQLPAALERTQGNAMCDAEERWLPILLAKLSKKPVGWQLVAINSC